MTSFTCSRIIRIDQYSITFVIRRNKRKDQRFKNSLKVHTYLNPMHNVNNIKLFLFTLRINKEILMLFCKYCLVNSIKTV